MSTNARRRQDPVSRVAFAVTITIGGLMFFGGIIMFIVSCWFFILYRKLTPKSRYGWPLWTGVLLTLCSLPAVYLVALTFRPTILRRRRRAEMKEASESNQVYIRQAEAAAAEEAERANRIQIEALAGLKSPPAAHVV